MDAIEALLTRYSALKLAEPAPSGVQLETILDSAARAPDHGKLRPWRFIVIEGEARRRFGDLLAESVRRKAADATAEMLDRERAKPLRAPLIVIVAAVTNPTARIPVVEQVAAVAAAAQNIMLAAFAQGFGAMWKTGDAAYDPGVKTALGLSPEDAIVGFMYLGTNAAEPPRAPRLPSRDFVRHWTAPAG